MTYIIFTISILLNALANILMKVGALKPKQVHGMWDVFLNMACNPIILAGIVCFALGLAAYNYVLIKINLSVAYPINTSVGYILVILASWLFLKETITAMQFGGIGLIIIGVWMVAR
ncbi:MAG: SMR family transporter [Desulfobacterota bacterium]|nr:SMR family transporter [Thermodesulfobacteriota bacterium]